MLHTFKRNETNAENETNNQGANLEKRHRRSTIESHGNTEKFKSLQYYVTLDVLTLNVTRLVSSVQDSANA